MAITNGYATLQECKDYLFRDTASFGSSSGLWGIIRVP